MAERAGEQIAAPTAARLTTLGLRRIAFNHVLPALFWLAVLFGGLAALRDLILEDAPLVEVLRQTASVTFLVLICALLFIRRESVAQRVSLSGSAVALAGTFSLVFIVSREPVFDSTLVLGLGTGITFFGIIWSIVSLAALGRCYGTLPDVRGLVTHGPYRLVRHPLYFGEIASGLGLLITIAAPVTVAIFAVFVALQLWRSMNEEHAIEDVFPEYAAYRARTRRVVPLIW